MNYLIIGIAVLVVFGGGIYTFLANNKIKKNGIEVEAEISRIDIEEIEVENDESNMIETETTKKYYVKYKNENGEVIEALLNNPKIGLKEGNKIKIKYLPEKPKNVLRIK